MNKFRVVVAAVVIAVFVAFGAFLVFNADTENSTEWERWVYVFGAAEAVAFAAIGWMFGREVNRQRAEKAEEGADKARADAQSERAKGATLAGLVRAGAASAGRQGLAEQRAPEGDDLAPALDYAAAKYDV